MLSDAELSQSTCSDPVTRRPVMRTSTASFSDALSRRLDGRLLVAVAALAGVCLFAVAGSAQSGWHLHDALDGGGTRLYSTLMSRVLGRRGSGGGAGTCATAAAVPKARIVAQLRLASSCGPCMEVPFGPVRTQHPRPASGSACYTWRCYRQNGCHFRTLNVEDFSITAAQSRTGPTRTSQTRCVSG